jgi:hypothetical protein
MTDLNFQRDCHQVDRHQHVFWDEGASASDREKRFYSSLAE